MQPQVIDADKEKARPRDGLGRGSEGLLTERYFTRAAISSRISVSRSTNAPATRSIAAVFANTSVVASRCIRPSSSFRSCRVSHIIRAYLRALCQSHHQPNPGVSGLIRASAILPASADLMYFSHHSSDKRILTSSTIFHDRPLAALFT